MLAKDDCDRLLNATLPFAEQMLKEHGAFLPFGAQMLLDGEIVSVVVDDGENGLRSEKIIDTLQHAFKAGAMKGDLVATALIYDVRVVPPEARDETDAVALDLDHREDYSVTIFFPYALSEGKFQVGYAFASDGNHSIFPPLSSTLAD